MRTILTLIFLSNHLISFCQDTVNRIDKNGQKTGYWVITSDSSNKKIPIGTKMEEGFYRDGKRTGEWKRWFPSGTLRGTYTYSNGKILGPAKFYLSNGCPDEEGYWKNHRWVGDYTHYREDSCGVVLYKFHYDSLGRRYGKSIDDEPLMRSGSVILTDSGSVKWVEHYDNGELKPHHVFFNSEDSLVLESCSTDSLWIWACQKYPGQVPKLFSGNGFARLYNLERQLAVSGYFKNYKLLYGYKFTYSSEKKLLKMEKLFNGVMIGECANR
jgi:antitoxin component YwqK of YwqJK toxin-antitoxin module